MTLDTRPKTATTRTAGAQDERLIQRRFTTPDIDPYDALEWELRSAVIQGPDGVAVFEQNDVEFPAGWSQNATNVVASSTSAAP